MDSDLKEKLQVECEKIIRYGDLSVLTPRIIRTKLQDNLGLEKDALESTELRKYIREIAEHITTKVLQDNESNETTSSPKKRKAPSPKPKKTSLKRPKKRGAIIEESDEDDESVQIPNSAETNSVENLHISTADSENESQDTVDNLKESIESEISEVEDVPSPKKSKKQATTNSERTPTKKTTGLISEKDQETIKNLKMYIGKCGVRKMWFREFKGIEDKPKLQIKKLKEILAELGVTGRVTIEKCKKIQAERELRAERESLSKDNIIEEDEKYGRRTRASRRGTAQPLSKSKTNENTDFSFLEELDSEVSEDEDEDGDETDEEEVVSGQSEESDSE
ncbi:hypothetical protein K7432_001653 [Basidiobolus ranarum]|uniref:Histone chaperone domain-containing protein n=1 Tax=Basidiobolus ranarum TaxID=34480 RepID=A0ABR2W956_9FUNG